ncbi:hypothetical protein NP493_150g02042 [Ridgeia piscesae]|uniref:Secreted protein n=1 Tax=Ridgeia piscesae TaxID=27915 RepID=A0AAD9P4C5_RIDPI|nr:hypothetical protein NP493_150g02042 [Ridgeia piscesae]
MAGRALWKLPIMMVPAATSCLFVDSSRPVALWLTLWKASCTGMTKEVGRSSDLVLMVLIERRLSQ